MSHANPLTRSRKQRVHVLLQQNRLDEARPLLEQVCNADRRDAESWYLLGAVNHHLRQLEDAAACYERVIALQPDQAEAHYGLGIVRQEQGNNTEAIRHYQQTLALNPGHLEACSNLGTVFEVLGHMDKALRCYEQALRLDPARAVSHYNLGNVQREQQRYEEAAQCYRRAIELQPGFINAYANLGMVLRRLGRLEEAVACCRRAVEKNPGSAAAHDHLAKALMAAERYGEAVHHGKIAITIDPRAADTYNNLGLALVQQQKLDEAIGYYNRSLDIREDEGTRNNLGVALALNGQYEEAITHYKRALAINVRSADSYTNLAKALLFQGKLDDAIAAFREGLKYGPEDDVIHSDLLLVQNYLPNLEPEALCVEHQRFGKRCRQVNQALTGGIREPERRLRIGYVSPDFRVHSVAYFLAPILAHHDHGHYEIYCYADVAQSDPVTEQFKNDADRWRDTHRKTNEELADIIRTDEIDILVDLAGHTANNRLLTFALKPAPIQISYLGYPNTTGLYAMDYYLTDVYADPPGQEHLYSEQLWRLPAGFLCYQPPEEALSVGQPNASDYGCITFGSFNAQAKINERVVACWARILAGVPSSRLIIKNGSLRDAPTCQRYTALFQSHGIPPERLEFTGWLDKTSHLALYNRIDIALDTFPYNGTTTSCEAMWMGVPVVTLEGICHAGRVGVSLLHQVGLTELIAKTQEEYVRIAANLAKDMDKLATLCAGLRPRMTASPLCDGEGFTRILEQAYREMWRKWCRVQTSA